MILEAPHPFLHIPGPSVFLAGSIDNGLAVNWQDPLGKLFSKKDITVLNPRRSDWDSGMTNASWHPAFRIQVEWELAAMDHADVILMYFGDGTLSPISLMELGLYASSGKLLVCCAQDYWRKGNVDIVCERYGVPTFSNLKEAGKEALKRLQERKK